MITIFSVIFGFFPFFSVSIYNRFSFVVMMRLINSCVCVRVCVYDYFCSVQSLSRV